MLMLMMDAPLHERQRTARHHHCCCTLTVQQWPSFWRDILRLFAALPVAIWLRNSFLIAAALAPASWHPHLSCAASGASDAPPSWGSAMGDDSADCEFVGGGRVNPFCPDGCDDCSSSSSGRIVVDVAPSVTADLNTPEEKEQRRAVTRWWIKKRHGECANCHMARGSPGPRATGGDGRCRWCGGNVCSVDCFRQHDVQCEERPPRDGGGNPE